MILKIILFVSIALVFLYLFFERYYHNKIRKSIKIVIHVNGTRGKSTTTRLIDAGLREAGYKVFTKTTGSRPAIIDTFNKEKEILRLGRANIIEQLKVLRKAYKEKAEVLVIECMAISKKLILLTEEKMLKSNITVITNVYHDHLDTMGSSLEEIAETLALSIPINGDVIISNDKHQDIFLKRAKENNSKVHISKPYFGEDHYDTELENISNSLEVARLLNIDEKIFLEGMKKYKKDIGAYSVHKIKDTFFYNGFSINDRESVIMKYEEIKKEKNEDINLLLNNREDRQNRVEEFIKIVTLIKPSKVFITGSNINYVYKKLKQANIDVVKYQKLEDLLTLKHVFLIGNYGNKGEKILKEIILHGEEVC